MFGPPWPLKIVQKLLAHPLYVFQWTAAIHRRSYWSTYIPVIQQSCYQLIYMFCLCITHLRSHGMGTVCMRWIQIQTELHSYLDGASFARLDDKTGNIFDYMKRKGCVPDTASYIRGWIQMVLAPNDLFSWNNKYNKYNEYNITDTFTCFFLAMHTTYSVHAGILKPWRGRLPCRLLILSRPLYSLIWAQLTLLVPALGIRSPLSQNGAPIHRVRAHSLTGIRNRLLKQLFSIS